MDPTLSLAALSNHLHINIGVQLYCDEKIEIFNSTTISIVDSLRESFLLEPRFWLNSAEVKSPRKKQLIPPQNLAAVDEKNFYILAFTEDHNENARLSEDGVCSSCYACSTLEWDCSLHFSLKSPDRYGFPLGFYTGADNSVICNLLSFRIRDDSSHISRKAF